MTFWQMGSSMPWWQGVLFVPFFCVIGVLFCSLLFTVLRGLFTLALKIAGLGTLEILPNSLKLGIVCGIIMPITLLILWPGIRPWRDEDTAP